MDRAEAAYRVALQVAMNGGDLEQALRDLLHVCGRRRDALEYARRLCEADAERQPFDVDIRRSLELLNGALRTSLYAPARV